MTHGLCRPALAVELALDFHEYPHDLVQYPRGFDVLGRVFFHELLHCWQVLSQAYLTRLAAEEFNQLLYYRDSGELPEKAGAEDLEGRFLAKHPEIGFSAHQLSEALCRFWDVQVIGADIVYAASTGAPLQIDDGRKLLRDPVSDAPAFGQKEFHRAMLVEDAYADPYRLAMERWGDQAMVVFPLVAHFSLQTDYPIDTFAAAIMKQLELGSRRPVSAMEPVWFRTWEAAREVVMLTTRALGIPPCADSGQVIRETALSTHQIFQHYLLLLEIAKSQWGPDYLEYAFSAPGRERGALSTVFHPSVTLMQGGRWLNEAPAERDLIRLTDPEKLASHLNSMASIAESLFETQRRLRLNRLVTRKRSGPIGPTAPPISPTPHLLPPARSEEFGQFPGVEIRRSVERRPKPRPLGRWRLDSDRRDIASAAWEWLLEDLLPELRVAELLTEVPVALPEDASGRLTTAAAELEQHLTASGQRQLPLAEVMLNLRYMPERTIVRDIGPYVLSCKLKETVNGPLRAAISAGWFQPMRPGPDNPTAEPRLKISILIRHDERARTALATYLLERFGTSAPGIREEPLVR
jgi:hypothetical protein